MSWQLSRGTALAAVAGVLVASTGFAAATQAVKSRKPSPAAVAGDDKAEASDQRASGVITKVEDIVREGAPAKKKAATRKRITINTAAVWADYARDHAVVTPIEGAPRTKAKATAKPDDGGVAEEGQPESPDSTVVIEVFPDAKLASTFRKADDETSTGSDTAAAAVAEDDEPVSAPKGKRAGARKKANGKAGTAKGADEVSVADLKVGLFVEVDYKEAKDESHRATKLTLIKPAGIANSAPNSAPGRGGEPKNLKSRGGPD